MTLWCRFAGKQFPGCNLSYLVTQFSEKIAAMRIARVQRDEY